MKNKDCKILQKHHITKAIFISLVACTAIGTISCKKEIDNPYIDNSIAIVYQNDIPYLINEQLETHSLEEFDAVEDRFSPYIIVEKNGLFGYIDQTGKTIIEPIYEKAFPMNEDKAIVILEGKRLIINNKGETIYKFPDYLSSESSFSENFLVVQKENEEHDFQYGYLSYNNGVITEPEIYFDFASKFKNGYGIVGNFEIIYDKDVQTGEIISQKKSETMKYNFFKENNELLFNDFKFDFCDTFYDGYARVAVYKDYDIMVMRSYSKDPVRFLHRHGLMYRYINEEGKYLTDSKGNIYEFPYAKNFNDEHAVTAKYIYNKITHLDVKEYSVINTQGQMNYIDAIYGATNYHYIHEMEDLYMSHEYMTQVPGKNWLGNFTYYDDNYLFRYGNTHEGVSWKIEEAYYDYYEHVYAFRDVKWELLNQDGSTPKWMIDYNNTYLNGTSSTVLVSNSVKAPYEMDEITNSDYYSKAPLTKIRISRSNKYGLVSFKSVDYLEHQNFVSYFVLVPIYDKIVY